MVCIGLPYADAPVHYKVTEAADQTEAKFLFTVEVTAMAEIEE